MKLGLLFGSFDPIHNGHLEIIQKALISAECDEVWLIVQPFNFYKSGLAASFADRTAMARLATQKIEKVGVYELDPMFTASHSIFATLKELKRQDKSRQLLLILGADLAQSLPNWEDYDEILALCKIFEVERSRQSISSGQVKQRVADGQPASDLTPQTVVEYIFEHGLYTRNKSRS